MPERSNTENRYAQTDKRELAEQEPKVETKETSIGTQ
jgi:hypothetical protein